MRDSERCRCGARIIYSSHIDMDDGKETYIYTCGVCGSEIEIKNIADPRRF